MPPTASTAPSKSKKTREERVEQIVDFAKTALGGRTPTEYWFEEVAPIERPEKAATYAGSDPEDWDAQITRWADAYRRHGASDDLADRDLADRHVQATFDVDLETFETEVIDFHEGQVYQTILGGNFLAVESGIRAATAVAENTQEDVDEE